jgi:hypothetical protein
MIVDAWLERKVRCQQAQGVHYNLILRINPFETRGHNTYKIIIKDFFSNIVFCHHLFLHYAPANCGREVDLSGVDLHYMYHFFRSFEFPPYVAKIPQLIHHMTTLSTFPVDKK